MNDTLLDVDFTSERDSIDDGPWTILIIRLDLVLRVCEM